MVFHKYESEHDILERNVDEMHSHKESTQILSHPDGSSYEV